MACSRTIKTNILAVCKNSCKVHRKYHYLSKLFLSQSNIQPIDSHFTCKSQKLMVYNAVMHQEHAGVYHLLPLGQRALEKLVRIIDAAMDVIDAQKITMPCLTSGALWKKSGRWDIIGPELFRLQDRNGTDVCLSPTHEESVTSLVSSQCPLSYRALPILLYQINTKFRDEMLPKYGLLRGREFIMKDLYTFDTDISKAHATYSRVCQAYCDVLHKLQLPYMKVEASTGNIGGVMSHEFHLPSDVGEDRLLVCPRCGTGKNREILDGTTSLKYYCETPDCGSELKESPGIEVGHTFLLGHKYSSLFKADYKDERGSTRLMEMGCYGLGVSRLLQASIQVLSSDSQMRWPYHIAPYKVCIIPQKEGYKAEEFMHKSCELAGRLETLPDLRSDVIVDDRTDVTVGKRLYEARRRGFPYIVIVNKMALNKMPQYEFIEIDGDESTYLSLDQVIHFFKSKSSSDETDAIHKLSQ